MQDRQQAGRAESPTNKASGGSQAELERSRGLLAAVLDSVGEGIITIDGDGLIVMINQEAQRIFGYEPEELAGKSLTVLMPPKYRELHLGGLKRYQETGVPRVIGKRLELEGRRKNGSVFPLEVRIAETRTATGLMFTGALRDITERKEMEETILRLSVPVLEIRPGLLLLPLMGEVTEERARQMTQELMQKVRATRARAVVLDVTGVLSISDVFARHLENTAQVAKLLGAQVILTGVSGAAARTFVEIGADLSAVTLKGDLRSGIAEGDRLVFGKSMEPARPADILPDGDAGEPPAPTPD